MRSAQDGNFVGALKRATKSTRSRGNGASPSGLDTLWRLRLRFLENLTLKPIFIVWLDHRSITAQGRLWDLVTVSSELSGEGASGHIEYMADRKESDLDGIPRRTSVRLIEMEEV